MPTGCLLIHREGGPRLGSAARALHDHCRKRFGRRLTGAWLNLENLKCVDICPAQNGDIGPNGELPISRVTIARLRSNSHPPFSPSEKFGRSVVIPGDSVVELGSDRPESPGIAKWDFSTSGGD